MSNDIRKALEAAVWSIGELDGLLNFAKYPAGGPIRRRLETIDVAVKKALALSTPEPVSEQPAEGVPVAAELYQDLDPELRWILGQICFQCISTAQALRLMGHEIPTRAEDEQAATLNWMLGLYAKHGKGWRALAIETMKKAKDARHDAAPQPEGSKS